MSIVMMKAIGKILSLISGNSLASKQVFNHQNQLDDDDDPDSKYSKWNDLPYNILGNIIEILNVTDLIRMSCACKSWRRSLLNQLENSNMSLGPQHPWLLLPQAPFRFFETREVSFLDMFEGKFRTMKQPHSVPWSWCCGSSKGWLVMANGPYCNPCLSLVNPVSGVTHPIPPLSEIPGFHTLARDSTWWYHRHPYNYIEKFDMSGSLVACLLFDSTALAFCEIGGDSWELYKKPSDSLLDFDEATRYCDILFSSSDKVGTTLYMYAAYPETNVDESDDVTEILTTKVSLFESKVELTIHIIPYGFEVTEPKEPTFEEHMDSKHDDGGCDFYTVEDYLCTTYLLETSKGKLLVVRSWIAVMLNKFGPDLSELIDDGGQQDNQERDSDYLSLRYYKTKTFEVYRLDPENGDSTRVCSLDCGDNDDDVIFVGSRGSFSLSSRAFKDGSVHSNSIYFVGGENYIIDTIAPDVSREFGVFDVCTGRVKRCLPSIPHPKSSNILWFTPSYH